MAPVARAPGPFEPIQGACQPIALEACPKSLLNGTKVALYWTITGDHSPANLPPELGGAHVPLIKNRYGKGRVRVMRIHRDGDRHEVSQLDVKAMIEGDFARAYTDADNSTSVSTDTIKNVVNIVARENTGLCMEEFSQVLAKRYLDTYPQIASVSLTVHETKWSRLSFAGKPHPHSFVLDSNGKPTVEVSSIRGGATTMSSGIDGFAFMKSTQSGWENYVKDIYTTIPPTADRMCATSMVASWKWSGKPASYPATNKKILDTVLEVFSMTYSKSVQDSLYRMGEAALVAVPEISEISMACPNMHFIPMNLSAFGLDNDNDVFLPTDEPHGQIECTVGRG
jgi:urate oxidase